MGKSRASRLKRSSLLRYELSSLTILY
ncbi:uncharacterized protein FFB14_10616 [Fusarium fujikuroi]|nr:uncharacterized protein FFB14_10616 [Fusarium fujikuroi]